MLNKVVFRNVWSSNEKKYCAESNDYFPFYYDWNGKSSFPDARIWIIKLFWTSVY